MTRITVERISELNISHIKIVPVKGNGLLLAYVSLTVDDCLAVRDIKIIQGADGPFLSFPSKRKKDGTFMDLFHPLNAITRGIFERRVLGEYSVFHSGKTVE